jgi:hypothetical protein
MQGEDDTTVVSGSMKTRSIFLSVSPMSLLTTRERYVRRNWHALLGNAERTHSLAGESGWLVQRQFDGFRHESNVTFRAADSTGGCNTLETA